MKDSKAKLENAHYIPNESPFPIDKDLQEGERLFCGRGLQV